MECIMALLGRAALAMWWDLTPALRAEFEDWHSHEHFPERLRVPGFLRASRFASATGGDGFFVMYELAEYETLTSGAYIERLNHPTPWSTKMMPLHRNMVRTQCQVVQSYGGVTARYVLTLRCTPVVGQEALLHHPIGEFAESVSQRPGIVGLHVLRHEAPKMETTTEQKIRGNSDRAADWIIVVSGYDLDLLRKIGNEELSEVRLRAMGALPETRSQLFALAYTAIPADVC